MHFGPSTKDPPNAIHHEISARLPEIDCGGPSYVKHNAKEANQLSRARLATVLAVFFKQEEIEIIAHVLVRSARNALSEAATGASHGQLAHTSVLQSQWRPNMGDRFSQKRQSLGQGIDLGVL